MEEITYQIFRGMGEDFEHARVVRRTVFCEEQGYSLRGEFDAADQDAWHIVGFINGQAVCTARALFEHGAFHLGRIAVLKEWRGQKVGRRLVQRLLVLAKDLGEEKVVLNSQADKTHFYETLGFTPTGNTSVDEGQPHAEMELILKEE